MKTIKKDSLAAAQASAGTRSRKKAGHRSWLPRGQAATGGHKGDIMTPEQRSALMARIQGKNTSPELEIAKRLTALGLKFESHPRDIPGRPDFLFRGPMIAVFIDGDFWHGFRFPLWRKKLALKWELKIEANRARDKRNMRRLRLMGWKVLRIWEHQVEQNPSNCVSRVLKALSLKPVIHS